MYAVDYLSLENNKPPVADAGPDKELTLPVDRTTLDGSKSYDDQKIVKHHWEKTESVLSQLYNSVILIHHNNKFHVIQH